MSKYIKELAWLLSSNTNKNFFSARDASRHLFQGSRAVKDTQVTEFINNLLDNELHLLTHNVYLEEFQTTFFNWVKGSTLGLSLYNSNFSNGTTQAFDSFYLRHSNKRFRCFVGEYFYHLKSDHKNK